MTLAIPTRIDLDGQYRALREAAGLLERSDRRSVVVSGDEAAEYLQGQLTNEIESLEPGQGSYAALLDRKGRMQGDMRVLRAATEIRLDTEDVAADAVIRHLSMYKIGRDVAIEEVTGSEAILSLIGPAAIEVAGLGPLGVEYMHRPGQIEGIAVNAVATDAGVDLIVSSDEVKALSSFLLANGAEAVSDEAAEIARVESGRPRFGREMTTATIPQEAGINERAVSFSKGCYIGQETVARLHYKGKPNRHLRGLRLAAPVDSDAPVRLEERELGKIGSAVISPAHGPIALAILRREAEPGAVVTVGDATSADVVELPF